MIDLPHKNLHQRHPSRATEQQPTMRQPQPKLHFHHHRKPGKHIFLLASATGVLFFWSTVGQMAESAILQNFGRENENGTHRTERQRERMVEITGVGGENTRFSLFLPKVFFIGLVLFFASKFFWRGFEDWKCFFVDIPPTTHQLELSFFYWSWVGFASFRFISFHFIVIVIWDDISISFD
jgi:hypothetical protein